MGRATLTIGTSRSGSRRRSDAAKKKAEPDPLLLAVRRVWNAFLAYGPVDDGRPEGDEFDASLMALMEAYHEAKAKQKRETK